MGNAGSGSGLLHEEVMDVLEEVQCKATAMTEGLVHPAREEILRELGLFILRKKRFGRILTAVCEYHTQGGRGWRELNIPLYYPLRSRSQ